MDKQEKRIYDRERYLRNHEEAIERDRKRRELNPKQGIKRATEWARKHPKELSIIQARCQQKRKIEALTQYGNGKIECSQCGYSDIRALSLDHINNDGQEHRKEIGTKLYRWLKRQNYPLGFQILCMNCQWVKKAEHQTKILGTRRKLQSK